MNNNNYDNHHHLNLDDHIHKIVLKIYLLKPLKVKLYNLIHYKHSPVSQGLTFCSYTIDVPCALV